MILKKEKIRRCGIFLFFDKEGTVDDYVVDILKNLQTEVEYLIVVCNGYVDFEGRKKLDSASNEVICRANLGLDVGGYREGLFYIGFKKLSEYDELVLLNYTFFGPLYPFSEMFQAMNSRDIDFWGITTHHCLKGENNPIPDIRYGYMPEHIQSHFFVLRQNLFLSYYYKDFMFNMNNPRTYNESVNGYEIIFTKYFEDLGFKWDVYCRSDIYKESVNHPIMFKSLEMIRDLRCPIIKRRAFFTEYADSLVNTCGETSVNAYEFIQNQTDYKTDYIWDNILRLENLRDIHRQMHFNYILSEEAYEAKNALLKQGIIFVLQNDEELVFCDDYFQDLAKVMTVEKINVSDYSNYGQVLLLIIDKSNEYNYIGIADLTGMKEIADISTFTHKEQDIENLFSTQIYIENILNTLQKESKLGALFPPLPLYGNHISSINDGWQNRYNEVCRYLAENKIRINHKRNSEPLVPYGGSLWVKSNLLSKLKLLITKTSEYDKETILLALPLLFQSQFYYSGFAYTESCAQTEIINQDFMLRENNKMLFEKYGAGYFHEVLNRLKIS